MSQPSPRVHRSKESKPRARLCNYGRDCGNRGQTCPQAHDLSELRYPLLVHRDLVQPGNLRKGIDERPMTDIFLGQQMDEETIKRLFRYIHHLPWLEVPDDLKALVWYHLGGPSVTSELSTIFFNGLPWDFGHTAREHAYRRLTGGAQLSNVSFLRLLEARRDQFLALATLGESPYSQSMHVVNANHTASDAGILADRVQHAPSSPRFGCASASSSTQTAPASAAAAAAAAAVAPPDWSMGQSPSPRAASFADDLSWSSAPRSSSRQPSNALRPSRASSASAPSDRSLAAFPHRPRFLFESESDVPPLKVHSHLTAPPGSEHCLVPSGDTSAVLRSSDLPHPGAPIDAHLRRGSLEARQADALRHMDPSHWKKKAIGAVMRISATEAMLTFHFL